VQSTPSGGLKELETAYGEPVFGAEGGPSSCLACLMPDASAWGVPLCVPAKGSCGACERARRQALSAKCGRPGLPIGRLWVELSVRKGMRIVTYHHASPAIMDMDCLFALAHI